MRTNRFGGKIVTVVDILEETEKLGRCIPGLTELMQNSFRRQLDVDTWRDRRLEGWLRDVASDHRLSPEQAAGEIAGRLAGRW